MYKSKPNKLQISEHEFIRRSFDQLMTGNNHWIDRERGIMFLDGKKRRINEPNHCTETMYHKPQRTRDDVAVEKRQFQIALYSMFETVESMIAQIETRMSND